MEMETVSARPPEPASVAKLTKQELIDEALKKVAGGSWCTSDCTMKDICGENICFRGGEDYCWHDQCYEPKCEKVCGHEQ